MSQLLTDVDLTGCPAITGITLSQLPKVARVDFSGQTNLKTLSATYCHALTDINIKNCVALETLTVLGDTLLGNIDWSHNVALKTLSYSGTEISNGDVSMLVALTDLSINSKVAELHAENCTELTSISVGNSKISVLDLSNSPSLTSVTVSNCSNLTTVKLSPSADLSSFFLNGSTKITTLYYSATKQSPATSVASAITAAEADNGVLYTDDQAAYYSTVETAALAKGWTIEPLA